jgi:hypothetical protein
MPTKSEYENFDDTVRELLKVPHGEIKATLEKEKQNKKKRKKRVDDRKDQKLH